MRRGLQAISLLIIMLAPVAAQNPPALQELVPSSTLLFVEVDSLETLGKALHGGSHLSALLGSKEMKDFLAPLIAAFRKTEAEVTPQVGTNLEGLGKAFGGQAALAVMGVRRDEGSPMPDLALSVMLGSQPSIARRVFFRVRRIVSQLLDVPVQSVRVGSRRVSIFDVHDRLQIYVCLTGGALYVTNSDAAMEDVLFALQGPPEGETLARSQRFRDARQRVNGDGAHHFAYLNFGSTWRALDGLFATGHPEYGLMMERLDLRKVTGAGLSVNVTKAGFRERLYIAGKGKDLVALLGQPGLTGATRVSASSVFLANTKMNWDALYRWLLATLDAAARKLQKERIIEARGAVRMWEEGALGFRLKDDLIDALGSEATLSVMLPTGSLIPRFLTLIEVTDGKKVEAVLASIKALLPKPLKLPEPKDGEEKPKQPQRVKLLRAPYRGKTLYILRIPGVPVTPTFAVVNGQLAVANNPNIVKRWIRSKGETLAEEALFKEALGLVGLQDLSDVYSMTYLDVARVAAYGYDNLTPLVPDFEVPLYLHTAKMLAAKLPSTEAITGPLKPMVVVTRRLDDGILMDASSPLPYMGAAWFFFEGALLTGQTSVLGEAIAPVAAGRPGRLGVLIDDSHAGMGARIAGIVPDTPAARAGLKKGDVIERMNGQEVRDADVALQRVAAMRAGDGLKLRIVRSEEHLTVELVLDAKPDKEVNSP